MLIMTLAYSQRSGNGTFLSTHVSILYLASSRINMLTDLFDSIPYFGNGPIT